MAHRIGAPPAQLRPHTGGTMRASTLLFLIVCALLAIGLAMAANDGTVIPFH